MALGKKTGGRQKGTPNKLSTNVKDNVISVFEQLGGTDHMARWAEENPSQFYNIYAKLLPLQVTGEDGGPIDTSLTIRLVSAEKHD
jgi:hypothetical protein